MRTGRSGVSPVAGGAGSSRLSWVVAEAAASEDKGSAAGEDIQIDPRLQPHLAGHRSGKSAGRPAEYYTARMFCPTEARAIRSVAPPRSYRRLGAAAQVARSSRRPDQAQ